MPFKTTMQMTPEQTVQANLEFYNQRNIDGFMSSLATNIEVYNLGEGEAALAGIEQVKSFYATLFNNSPTLHSNILKRIVIGNKVIDHEHISGRNGSDDIVELVLIYQVTANKIEKITVIRE